MLEVALAARQRGGRRGFGGASLCELGHGGARQCRELAVDRRALPTQPKPVAEGCGDVDADRDGGDPQRGAQQAAEIDRRSRRFGAVATAEYVDRTGERRRCCIGPMPRRPGDELDTGEGARSAEQRRRRTVCVDADRPGRVRASAGERQRKLRRRRVSLCGPYRDRRAAVGAHKSRLRDRARAPTPTACRRRCEIALQHGSVPGESAALRCRHEGRHPGPRDDRHVQAALATLRLESDMNFFGRVGELVLEGESRRGFRAPGRQRWDGQCDQSAMARSDNRFPARSDRPRRRRAPSAAGSSARSVEDGPRRIAAGFRRAVDKDAQRARCFCHRRNRAPRATHSEIP